MTILYLNKVIKLALANYMLSIYTFLYVLGFQSTYLHGKSEDNINASADQVSPSFRTKFPRQRSKTVSWQKFMYCVVYNLLLFSQKYIFAMGA